ncbi:MAG: hypothetical protein SFT68_04955, partial [Rickettsiaceae bacterium]|nr:hypothetical protein [Rickettsiaceae bacterium]
GSSPLDFSCQPIRYQNHLYFAIGDGHLVKLSLDNQSIIWKKKIEDIISMSKAGDIFLTNNARQIAAISDKTGDVLWVNKLSALKSGLMKSLREKTTIFSAPIVTNNGIYVFSADGSGFLINSINGEIEKRFAIPSNIFGFSIFNGSIFLFDKKNIYQLD